MDVGFSVKGMKGKALVWIIGLGLFALGLYLYSKRQSNSLKITTPSGMGGLSLTKTATGGLQVNAALDISKPGKKKKKKLFAKIGNFVKKNADNIGTALSFVPGVGPLLGAGVKVGANQIKTGNLA